LIDGVAAMPVYIAMLRGINVGGHKRVPMERLRALCEELGFEQVRTFIQSGNLVFKAAKSSPADLSAKIEKKIMAEFGFAVSVMTRTPEELAQAMRNSPFAEESKVEPAKVHVVFLSGVPKAEAAKKLEALATPAEQIRHRGREVHLYYRDGMGRAKITGSVLERVLSVAATARNWNTVNKLHEMAAGKC
jgi:uncharacterized protein (DUF1697 family)